MKLTVTDNEGATGTDTMLLAVAGPCEAWPQSNADLDVRKLRIINFKRCDKTNTWMFGNIDLPEVSLGYTLDYRMTIELFGALPDEVI